MIHFNFVVDEFEADAIFSAIQDEIVDCHVGITDNTGTVHMQEWFQKRIKFLEALKEKMKNSRVPD